MIIKARLLSRLLSQPGTADDVTRNTIDLDAYQQAIAEHHGKAFPELAERGKLVHALFDKLLEETTELEEAARYHEEVYGSKKVYSIRYGLDNPVMDEAGDVLVVLLRIFELYGLDTFWLGEALDRSLKKFKAKYPIKETVKEIENEQPN